MGGWREKLIGGKAAQRERPLQFWNKDADYISIYISTNCTCHVHTDTLYHSCLFYGLPSKCDDEETKRGHLGVGLFCRLHCPCFAPAVPHRPFWIHREVQRFSLITAVSWREREKSPPPSPPRTHNRGVPGIHHHPALNPNAVYNTV